MKSLFRGLIVCRQKSPNCLNSANCGKLPRHSSGHSFTETYCFSIILKIDQPFSERYAAILPPETCEMLSYVNASTIFPSLSIMPTRPSAVVRVASPSMNGVPSAKIGWAIHSPVQSIKPQSPVCSLLSKIIPSEYPSREKPEGSSYSVPSALIKISSSAMTRTLRRFSQL